MAIYPQIHYIELCAGTGMLGFAIEIACEAIQVDCRPICYVEREAVAAATLVERFSKTKMGVAPIWDDIKTFNGSEWRGKVDILAAGYPCQPFSLAGKRLGERDPRHLWPDIRRIVKESKPGLCFFENVPGHLSKGLGTVIGDLREMGYSVTPGLFESKETGATMQNRRLFIFAHRFEPDEFIQLRTRANRYGRQAELAQTEIKRSTQSGCGCRGEILFDSTKPTCGELAASSRAGGEPRPERERVCEGRHWVDGKLESTGHEPKCSEQGNECDKQTNWTGESSESIYRGPKLGETEIGGFPGSDAAHDDGAPYREIDSPIDAVVDLHYCPGRNDYRTWAAVAGVDASRMPCIESGVRRVGNGMVSESDRLRLIGNGVDPLQAAYAFLALLACAINDEELIQ